VDIEAGEGKSVCMASLFFRGTAHLQHKFLVVKGTYVQVCDASRPGVQKRSDRLFLMPLLPRGAGPSQQNAKIKIRKIEISKTANRKTKNLKTFIAKFFPRDRSRNCFPQILVLRIGDKTFASSSPSAPLAMCEVNI
jgi:hypothetical protein